MKRCPGWTNWRGTHYRCGRLFDRHLEHCSANGTRCYACGQAEERSLRAKARMDVIRARQDRRAGRTYGPAAEGEDIFAGFRRDS